MFAAKKRHLDDNALVRRYLAERGLEVLESADEPLLKHLAHCPTCGARYTGLASLLEEGRALAVEQADTAFTADRLSRQREKIMRRLEAQNGARVLTFPAAAKLDRIPAASRPMLRWVAAAAVAGVMVGITAGHFIPIRELGSAGRSASTSVGTTVPGAPAVTPSLQAAGKDSFQREGDQLLSEVDGALTDQRTSELTPIYALTLQGRDLPKPVNSKY